MTIFRLPWWLFLRRLACTLTWHPLRGPPLARWETWRCERCGQSMEHLRSHLPAHWRPHP